jgi:hypothetical protein
MRVQHAWAETGTRPVAFHNTMRAGASGPVTETARSQRRAKIKTLKHLIERSVASAYSARAALSAASRARVRPPGGYPSLNWPLHRPQGGRAGRDGEQAATAAAGHATPQVIAHLRSAAPEAYRLPDPMLRMPSLRGPVYRNPTLVLDVRYETYELYGYNRTKVTNGKNQRSP